MTERNRRIGEDYEGEAWSQNIVAEAIGRRFTVTAPGNKVAVRPGTPEMIVDVTKGITWADVMKALEQFGIIKPKDDAPGKYIKQVPGLGSFGTNLRGVMKASDGEFFGQINIADKQLRAHFIDTLLKRGNQACMFAVPGLDLTQLVPQFEAQFESALKEALKSGQNVYAQNGSIRSTLKHTFITLLEKNSKQTKNGGLVYNGTESRLNAVKIVDIWTGIIFGGLASLPRK